MAELCSLENAFPNIGETGPSREERKAARKKAKRCKGPALTALEAEEGPDPDRLFSKTEDIPREGFQTNTLPKIPKSIEPSNLPPYFGKGVDDEEGFSSFSSAKDDDPNYRLEPDFTKTFDTKGIEKAMGSLLPDPNLSDRWKPMTETSYTAFGPKVKMPTAIGARPGWASISQIEKPAPIAEIKPRDESWLSKDDKNEIIERMNNLVGRLDEMERRRIQNTQTELLLFVGTGMLLLFTFELVSR
jgi:hypothetical protein